MRNDLGTSSIALSAIVAFVIFLTGVPVLAGDNEDVASAVKRVAANALADSHTPGMAVAVIRNGVPIVVSGFGVASSNTTTPVTEHTLFPIGSLTKMMTAMAIEDARRRHLLSLDVPISHYVKGLSRCAGSSTLNQLLSDTAGLRDMPGEYGTTDEADLGRFAHRIDDAYCTLPRGRFFSYSNVGYALAGYVLQQVMRVPYADAMRSLVFAPADMTETGFRPAELAPFSVASGHRTDSSGTLKAVPRANDTRLWPAGYALSSVTDVAKFVQLLFDPKLSEDIETAHAPLTQMFAGGSYGYGLILHDQAAMKLVEHAGSMPGTFGYVIAAPRERSAVIVLANSERLPIFDVAHQLFAKILPYAIPSPEPVTAPSPAERAAIAGTFANRWPVQFLSKGDRLYAHQFGNDFPVEKLASGLLAIVYPNGAQERIVTYRGTAGSIEYVQMDLWTFRRQSSS